MLWVHSDLSKEPGAIHVFSRDLEYYGYVIKDFKIIKWLDNHQVVELEGVERAYEVKKRGLVSEFAPKEKSTSGHASFLERSCDKFFKADSNKPETKNSIETNRPEISDLNLKPSGVETFSKHPKLKLQFKKLEKEVSTGSVGTPLGNTHSNH